MNKIYNDYLDDLIKIYPEWNTYLQIPKYKHLQKYYTNISKTDLEKQKKFYEKYKKRLEKRMNESQYKKYPKNIKLYDKILKYEIDNSLDSFKYNFHLLPIDQMDNIIINYMIDTSGSGDGLYKFNTIQDYKDYIHRTKEFSKFCNQCILNMKEGISKDIVLPERITKKLINDLEYALINKTYNNRNVQKAIKQKWNYTMDIYLIKPVTQLIYFLKNVYLPKTRKTIGLYDLPDGNKMYEYLIRINTTLDSNSSLSSDYINISPESIHKLGQHEVKRIEKEMNHIKNKYGYKNTPLSHFNKEINKMPEQCFKTPEDVKKAYENMRQYIWKNVMPKYFDISISHDYEIKSVPKSMEMSSSQAYYQGGDLNGKRKGIFYINQRDVKNMLKMEVESLSLHEGNCGHHYQTTIANDSDIPTFIKICAFNGFSEGWGLYSENLGIYESDLSYYGKLNNEMFRAVRLVIDTGIHHYKWSYDKCKKYFKKYTQLSDKNIENEIDRYIVIPGQALSYKIGEKTLLSLRNNMCIKNKMNIKDFHRKVLENGNIPLKVLIEHINNN